MYLLAIFWGAILIIAYTYVGYPLMLLLLNRIRGHAQPELVEETSCVLPRVSLLIAAYNEEKVIAKKIENCLGLDYPTELLDIRIGSDGSSDKTNEIVKCYEQRDGRVKLLEFPRTGKSGVINKAVPGIGAEIIVFSDANTMLECDSVKRLARRFADSRIGCVCGRLVYRNPGEVVSGKGESLYWRYETSLKKMESTLGYVAGANGAIYAIRRCLFEPLPKTTINDDFTISMRIVLKGFRSVYDEKAIAYEDVAPTVRSEFRRHVRDAAGHYIAVVHLSGLLNPLHGLSSFIYWSHRMMRWSAPFLLIAVFFVNVILLNNKPFGTLLLFQCFFYLSAGIGWFRSGRAKVPFASYLPFYFCNLNAALLVGFVKAVLGGQKVTWESTERRG
jgi:cellulose synthase/poly-beta-1,6-N-acetylglucosamine synthase-like glycosyltransferase